MNENYARTWRDDLTDWRDYMRASKQSDETIRLRTWHMEKVIRDLRARNAASIDGHQLIAWIAGQDWSANTARSYRATLRAFYAWARDVGHIEVSPAHALPQIKVPRVKARPTPEEAFRAALSVATGDALLMIMLAGYCGLRRGEIAHLRGDALERDLLGYSLRVVGKGGHERLIPIVVDELLAAIRTRGTSWLFPSPRPGRTQHVTPGHVGKVVSAFLPEGYTTHTLRHRFGTVTYQRTKDLRAVQELMGHAKPETTMIYTQVASADLRAVMLAAA